MREIIGWISLIVLSYAMAIGIVVGCYVIVYG